MTTRTHHFRGALGGLLLGISIGIFLTIYGVVLFGSLVPALVAIGGLLLGLLWSFVAPNARRARAANAGSPDAA